MRRNKSDIEKEEKYEKEGFKIFVLFNLICNVLLSKLETKNELSLLSFIFY